MQRIGIYGGTFNPIHYAHLAVAEEARWAVQLERVYFVPAAQQPFKATEHQTAPHHRLAMTHLACAGNPYFVVSNVEVQRAAPSYTVETLQTFRAQFPVATQLWFILGADALADLPRWHDAQRIIALAQLAAVGRPGAAVDLAGLDTELPGIAAQTTLLDGPQLDVSSTALRQRLIDQQPVRYQLPEPVRNYISTHRLYTTAEQGHE